MAILLRLEKLRQSMADAGVDAYIITGSDPHGMKPRRRDGIPVNG